MSETTQSPPESQPPEPPVQYMSWKVGMHLGLTVIVPLVIAKFVLGFGCVTVFHWIEFALATPVLGIVGARIYFGAWEELSRRRKGSCDIWITFFILILYGYSLWALTLKPTLSWVLFTEAGVLVTGVSFLRARHGEIEN